MYKGSFISEALTTNSRFIFQSSHCCVPKKRRVIRLARLAQFPDVFPCSVPIVRSSARGLVVRQIVLGCLGYLGYITVT